MRFVPVLLIVAACGTEAPTPGVVDGKQLLPIAVGNVWTYRVTDGSGVVSTKTQTVVSTTSTADGRDAFLMETSRVNNKGTRSVQLVDNGRLLRASESTLDNGAVLNNYRFEPYGLRIDSNFVTVGDTYADMHKKLKLDASGSTLETEIKDHTFYVEGAGEIVEVPAGTFECVRVRREKSGAADKIYWYAPGVGKVKEIGGQTEELSSVVMP